MTRKGKFNYENSKYGVATKQKAEFTPLRKSLFAQFSPTTPLQGTAVEAVVCCSWRCKLATRLYAKRAEQLLGQQTSEAEGEIRSETDSRVRRWYPRCKGHPASMLTALRFVRHIPHVHYGGNRHACSTLNTILNTIGLQNSSSFSAAC